MSDNIETLVSQLSEEQKTVYTAVNALMKALSVDDGYYNRQGVMTLAQHSTIQGILSAVSAKLLTVHPDHSDWYTVESVLTWILTPSERDHTHVTIPFRVRMPKDGLLETIAIFNDAIQKTAAGLWGKAVPNAENTGRVDFAKDVKARFYLGTEPKKKADDDDDNSESDDDDNDNDN